MSQRPDKPDVAAATSAASAHVQRDGVPASLLETLDRLLAVGVVAQGDLTVSVAGVDLVYINLKALLTSVANLANSQPIH